ncbi:MAG: ABC transporter ATP-binding protein [Spirochaetaceae bacterium]|jgi:oligopeptide transport system ATP-binding protein|nr:ABC transporter ATP-binding protein [Spirochaetaceae bacterium]
MMVPRTPLLEVRDLRTSFFTPDGEVRAVRGISFALGAGETLGIVGESGSGKTVTALSVLGLLAATGKITGGELLFHGEDLARAPQKTLRKIRGKKISMIFQDSVSSLNPLMTIGKQVGEMFTAHPEALDSKAGGPAPFLWHGRRRLFRRALSGKEIDKQVTALLSGVQIPDSGKRRHFYPHELSGGMRQRAMIAIALACRPEILIADEPTTALDLTIQSQIIRLLKNAGEEAGMSIIFITHDLGLVAELCSRAIVMYAGMIMEEASVDDLFDAPSHPYTLGLFNSTPGMETDTARKPGPIPGSHPDMLRPPPGCPFSPRCASAGPRCFDAPPPRRAIGGPESGHFARCWLL